MSSLSLWMRAYSKSSMTRVSAVSLSSSSGPGFTKTGWVILGSWDVGGVDGTLDAVVGEAVKADDDGGGFFSGVQVVIITAGNGWRGCKLEIWCPSVDTCVPVVYCCEGWEMKNWGWNHGIVGSLKLCHCRGFGLAIRLGLRMNCSFCARHDPVKPV